MGLRGIENSLTAFENVFVPNENVIGREGKGLKIALTTLNTGRLSLPALSAAAARYALKISREFANERVQWGKPVGKHDAGRAEARVHRGQRVRAARRCVDVSSRLADDKRNDIRIEAAHREALRIELGWQVVDEMVQIRGGRGYETAESLHDRGERPVPAEQMIRDMRINRIFEGSSGDHAAADRARGGRPAPQAGDAADEPEPVDASDKANGGAQGRQASTPAGCRSRPSARAEALARIAEFGALASTCAGPSVPRGGWRSRRSTR